MKSSSTRRVLKSVVGPALGATLGALVAGGCAKEEAKPAPTTTQPDTAAVPTAPPAAPAADAKVEAATPVEPEKAIDAAPKDAPKVKEGNKPDPADGPAPKGAPKKKPGARVDPADGPAPKKEHAAPPAGEPKKEEPKKSPSTEWYAGTMLERDIRPIRPARRGTDATVHALLTGLHDPALRPLA